ncbi:MAG TPA: response regulator [Thermoanaerobaculia bacterium]
MSGVLIVDDDQTICLGLQMLLECENIPARVTVSPFELPFAISQMDPDVVLIDLGMPSISGEAILRTLGRRRLRRKAAILLFSGRGAGELSRLAEELGADGFICKSDDTEQIIRIIRFWIDQRARTERAGGGA